MRLLLISLLCTPTLLFGQNKAVAVIDTNQYLIGDWINVHLYVEHEPGMDLTFPLISDSILKLEVIEVSEAVKKESNGIVKEMLDVTLTVFDSGYYVIPPFNFILTSNGQIVDSMQTEPLLVTVQTIEIDTTKGLMAIKGPLDIPYAWSDFSDYVYVILAIIAALFFIAYYFIFMHKKEQPVARVRPKLPPHEIALRKLNELAGKKLWQKGEIKAYYTEITEIIREYIEYRFDSPALESTTDEIVQSLQYRLVDSILQLLRILLQIADLVKFAKADPMPDENERVMRDALSFVNETKMVIQPTEEVSNVG